MIKTINRNAQFRASGKNDDGKRTAEFVISNEKVDTYGTVFKKAGWKFDRYLKNPVVSYNHGIHSSDPDMIIGTSEIFFDGDDLIGRVTFEDETINPLAHKIANKVDAGTLRMASIGAIPRKADWGDKEKGEDPNTLYFSDQTLVEWAITPVGSNPDAHKRNTEGVEAFKKELKSANSTEEKEPKENRVFEAQLLINKNRK